VQELVELMTPGAVASPEGPRWRNGALWFSDQWGTAVWRWCDGELASVIDVPRPSGLGFMPDGSIVVASMGSPPLVTRHGPGDRHETLADLTSLGVGLNDLTTDAAGRSYVNAYGPAAFENGGLALLVTGEEPRLVAEGMAMPNGMAITPDGSTLVVSESWGGRISAFDIEADGSLSNRRVWAEVEDMHPDGLCLDANGDVWVASFSAYEFLHVREGGEVLQRVPIPSDRWALACALGGDDGRTLFLCSAETDMARYSAGDAVGHLESIRVDVPGVERP
jgi:sugar lactone lactonase YvrE